MAQIKDCVAFYPDRVDEFRFEWNPLNDGR
jgi:hypothetical protein